jgi:hypothetical protein
VARLGIGFDGKPSIVASYSPRWRALGPLLDCAKRHGVLADPEEHFVVPAGCAGSVPVLQLRSRSRWSEYGKTEGRRMLLATSIEVLNLKPFADIVMQVTRHLDHKPN